MQAAYPDSLFIVTGDHSAILTPFDTGIIPKREPYLRELTMPCLHFHHRDLNRSWFQAEIASHLNILPTIFELVAPAGFGYYSLLPSLLEPAARVVTPYAYLTKDEIGLYRDNVKEKLGGGERVGGVELEKERDALLQVTARAIRDLEGR